MAFLQATGTAVLKNSDAVSQKLSTAALSVALSAARKRTVEFYIH
jgi:hypothetical protein